GDLPPLLFAALRLSLALVPAIFFLRRPAVNLGNLALYGLLIGVGQFGLLYIAMDGHISPGIASLVLQAQVFFTIGLAMKLDGERVRGFQWLALSLASAGVINILWHTDGTTTALGLTLTLMSAFAWGGSNMAAKRGNPENMLAYVVWSSVFAIPPLYALAFAFEGSETILAALRGMNTVTWAAVAWQAWGNTLFGFVVWGWLLTRHPAATISPMSLLVPIWGMGASAWLLGETLPAWKLVSAVLVLAGLALNLFWPRLRARLM
ncbi:MAG: EamA family transporter, partial [Candidatus Accumulibacter sp.]|nr:EamA family transporter [Accumulibacter sp.]